MSQSALPTLSSLTSADALLVEEICTRFEDAWQKGEQPRIEDYQHEISEAAWPVLLGELLMLDVEYRRRHGERPEMDYYAERFPEWKAAIAALLESADSRRAKSISLAAADKPAAERAALLDKACGSDDPLRRRVEKLLQAHDHNGSSLARQVSDIGTTAPPAPPCEEGFGSRIGPYKLFQKIGEGGMGVVWMAERQEPVRQMVALKVIKPGMDSKQILARFEAERQTLALMDHPNIAKVLDAGTTAHGRPYFVMELVKGIPITTYCDQHQLAPKERLELFMPVCQAIQHAHQKAIIHRDIKPGNVLVASYDGEPVPKVIDFGVAKAIGQKLTDRTMFTEVGQIIGTLEYMSPEQAELNQLDIDTRSDIYSLGVLLYELLTGSPPFTAKQLRSAGFAEMLRIIREMEPPNPSAKLSSSDELPAIAACRKLEPRLLTKVVHGELDWIVMKCLKKERGRRYVTALELAEDLRLHLAGEPIKARPVGRLERAVKWARRRPAVVALIGVVSAAVVILATATALVLAANENLLAANKSEREAKELESKAKEVAQTKEAEANSQKTLAEQQKALAEQRAAALQQALAHSTTMLAHSRWKEDPTSIWLVNGLLEKVSPQFRTAGWRYLKRQFEGGYATLIGHSEKVTSVAFSPDGKFLASAGYGPRQEVKIWDAHTGEKLRDLSGGGSVAFNPDGTLLAATGRSITFWDTRSWQEIRKIEDATDRLAFSPDGKMLATLDTGGLLNSRRPTIRDVRDGGVLQHLGAGQLNQNFGCFAFSADGSLLATGSASSLVPAYGGDSGKGDNTIKLWQTKASAELFPRQLIGHTRKVQSLAISPDGRLLASGAANDGVKLWELSTGRPLQSKDGKTQADLSTGITALAFSPDGLVLAAGSSHGTIHLWDVATAKEIRTFRGHDGLPKGESGQVTSLIFRTFADVTNTGRVRYFHSQRSSANFADLPMLR